LLRSTHFFQPTRRVRATTGGQRASETVFPSVRPPSLVFKGNHPCVMLVTVNELLEILLLFAAKHSRAFNSKKRVLRAFYSRLFWNVTLFCLPCDPARAPFFSPQQSRGDPAELACCFVDHTEVLSDSDDPVICAPFFLSPASCTLLCSNLNSLGFSLPLSQTLLIWISMCDLQCTPTAGS